MKKCINCAKDIPDTAFHCVFCGAKQGQSQSAGPAQKTIMGYSAADLGKLLPQQQGGQPGGYPPQAGADQRTMMVGAGGGPPPGGADQRTMMAGAGGVPLPQHPQHPQQGQPMGGAPQRTMMAGPGGAPYPPGMAPGDQRTMMAGMQGQPMSPMQPMTPMHQPPMQVASPHVMHQPMQPTVPQQPFGAPVGQRPQYLASQSAARDLSPVEPWGGSLRAMLILFGLALLISFAGPWSIRDGNMEFMWKMLTAGGGFSMAKLWPLILGVSGLVALLFGLLPVPTAARGVVAALIGIGPIVATLTIGGIGGAGGGGMPLSGWMAYALFGGLILGATGLLVRSAYRGAFLGRLLALIGCGAILAVYLVPQGGTIPLLGMFQRLGGGGGTAGLVQTAWLLLLFIAAALGLIMSFMPSGTSGGTGLFAWLLILWPFGLALLGTVILPIIGGADIGGMLKTPGIFYVIIDTLAFSALGAYGLATIFGKSLEA